MFLCSPGYVCLSVGEPIGRVQSDPSPVQLQRDIEKLSRLCRWITYIRTTAISPRRCAFLQVVMVLREATPVVFVPIHERIQTGEVGLRPRLIQDRLLCHPKFGYRGTYNIRIQARLRVDEPCFVGLCRPLERNRRWTKTETRFGDEQIQISACRKRREKKKRLGHARLGKIVNLALRIYGAALVACARPTAGPRWNRLCRRTPDFCLEPPTIFSWPVPARRSDSATRCDTRHTTACCRCLSPRADHSAARTRDSRLSRPRASPASAALVLPEAKPARNAAAVAPVLRPIFFFFFLFFYLRFFFLRRAKTHHRIR